MNEDKVAEFTVTFGDFTYVVKIGKESDQWCAWSVVDGKKHYLARGRAETQPYAYLCGLILA